MAKTAQDRELQDNELATVSGGLVVPSIIAVLIDPLPPKDPRALEKHWFNGG
jgi:bacteriocin-like protein